MTKKCDRCKEKSWASIAMMGGQAALCNSCYNGWFELRDKIVKEAFEEYIKDGSSPKKSSTRQ